MKEAQNMLKFCFFFYNTGNLTRLLGLVSTLMVKMNVRSCKV